MVEELLTLLEEAAKQKGKHEKPDLTGRRLSFQQSSSTNFREEELLVETANEGEY